MSERITNSIIVKGSPEEVYRQWSQYETFPVFMKYIKTIDKLDEKTSRWVVDGPLGKNIEWTAEITREDDDRRIAWKTLKGDIDINGQVTFMELPENQTQINVLMMYALPGGILGKAVSSIFANPEKRLHEGLQNFKDLIEGHYSRLPDKGKDNKA